MSNILILIIAFSPVINVYAMSKVVNPRQVYTYEQMTLDIKELVKKYPSIISYQSLGKTKFNRDIWAVKLGKGKTNILINASHHAREWITTNLVMNMLEAYAREYENQEEVGGYKVNDLLNKISIYFVPMVNPDGVTLQQKGISAFPKEVQEDLIRMNGGSYNFTRWKANAEGIDLNRQYPAGWGSLDTGGYTPYYQFYKGEYPLQAAEVKVLTDFVYKIKPEIAVSYHSTGRRVYWYFSKEQKNIERDHQIALKIGKLTGYEVEEPINESSGGGFSDWFVQEFERPGITPEVCYLLYETEVPLYEYDEIWKRNRNVGLLLANEGYNLYKQRMKKAFTEIMGKIPIDLIYNLLDLTSETYEDKLKKIELFSE